MVMRAVVGRDSHLTLIILLGGTRIYLSLGDCAGAGAGMANAQAGADLFRSSVLNEAQITRHALMLLLVSS